MLRKYFLINIILISAAIFLGIKLYDSYAKPLVIPAKSIKKQIPAEEQGEKKTENPVNKKNDSSVFQVIVQKDLFRPSRTEPKIEEISKTGHPQALPPKLIGTVITESGAKAYLEDSVTKTTRAFGLKESVAGFIVHEIKENTVVLIKGEEKIELKITRVQTIEPPGKKPSAPISQINPGPSPVQQPMQPPVRPLPMQVPPPHALPPPLQVQPAPQAVPIIKPVK